MLTLDALKNFGADVEAGMARCINNEAFYMRMVRMAIADANFDKLLEAAEAGDVKTGFEAAHALKGIAGNLELTAIFTPVSELTERLRGGADCDFLEESRTICGLRDTLKALDE